MRFTLLQTVVWNTGTLATNALQAPFLANIRPRCRTP
jgi:hypothetical protein